MNVTVDKDHSWPKTLFQMGLSLNSFPNKNVFFLLDKISCYNKGGKLFTAQFFFILRVFKCVKQVQIRPQNYLNYLQVLVLVDKWHQSFTSQCGGLKSFIIHFLVYFLWILFLISYIPFTQHLAYVLTWFEHKDICIRECWWYDSVLHLFHIRHCKYLYIYIYC